MSEPLSLRQLQMVELGALKELQRVCDKHSLRYYLLGGSLLGAARHQGFVPWDDDIDVGLPRPDYERFLLLSASELEPPYAIQTYRTERQYPFLFAKLLHTRTRLYDEATRTLPIRHCVAIDVFPLDGVPRSALARQLHRCALTMCRFRLGVDLPRRGPKKLLAMVTKLIPRGWATGLFELLAGQYRFDDSEVVVNPAGAWGYSRESVPRAWLGTGTPLVFEDSAAQSPTQWREYLAHVYDDFMRLPPEAKRTSIHHYSAAEMLADHER